MPNYPTKFHPPTFLFFFFVTLLHTYAATATATATFVGRRVGGRFPVKNVDSNEEIQQLGRYCVREYNRQLTANGSSPSTELQLMFSKVVAAERQVVSGIKYYLEISAATRGGVGPTKNFEAVVVVKPWAHSKELLDFTPATFSYMHNIK